MTQDPFRKEENLRRKLEQYKVNMPDFPMKPKRWQRLIHFLGLPTKNPIDSLMTTFHRLTLLKIAPIVVTMVITIIQLII